LTGLASKEQLNRRRRDSQSPRFADDFADPFHIERADISQSFHVFDVLSNELGWQRSDQQAAGTYLPREQHSHLDTDITQTDRSLPLFIMHDLASFLLLGATLGWNRSFLCFCEWIDSQSSGAVEAEVAGGSGMGLGVCSLRGPIAAMVSSAKSYICQ
jgi:hypothetical protein